jgi:hypothetical protein
MSASPSSALRKYLANSALDDVMRRYSGLLLYRLPHDIRSNFEKGMDTPENLSIVSLLLFYSVCKAIELFILHDNILVVTNQSILFLRNNYVGFYWFKNII